MLANVSKFTDLSPGYELDLEIDERGIPANPAVIVDGDWVAKLPVLTAATLLRRSMPISIVVAQTIAVPPEVVAAADLVIARPGACAGAIETDDPPAEAAMIVSRVAESPLAAVSLAWLLRTGEHAEVTSLLAAESAAYSMLLSSREFRTWLAARGEQRAADSGQRVRLSRHEHVLRITLARPQRRNAMDRLMRHALLEALQIAQFDEQIHVEIDAEGPSFSTGGDLDEFGSATDPGAAHLIRVSASVGQLIHRLRARVVVRVHGACLGAGIELPAFAGRIVAAPDAVFGLPEVAMGLIPGAGGTVSIPARIGRARTFWLAVSGEHINAATAREWGLVDEVA